VAAVDNHSVETNVTPSSTITSSTKGVQPASALSETR
jgi:hypothetical protein